MYLATFLFEEQVKIGVLTGGRRRIIPIDNIIQPEPPRTMLELIEMLARENAPHSDAYIKQIQKAAEEKDGLPVNRVKIMAPIPHPKRGVICLGKNYQEHVQEIADATKQAADIPKYPVYFHKIVNEAPGDQDYIPAHSAITKALDYEVELAVIIGKEGKNIPVNKAEEYIFGYTILNDITARDLQKRHQQWYKGKSLDGTCPMGPYIVHKSAVEFPPALTIQCSVNGELRQNDNTSNLIYDIPRIISDFSRGLMLKPGDIISTGTPSGVGMGFKPFKFLQSGDKIECYIEKIGTLTNIVE